MARQRSTPPGRPARARRDPDGAGRRSRTRDPERTKAKIITAATELFTQLGLNGASLDDIAKKAGINRGLIYHYYKTKDFLFDQVLARPLAAYVQSHLEFLQRRELDPDTLRVATEQFFRFLGRRPELCRLLGWTLAMQRFSVDLAQLEFTRALYARAIERIEEGQLAGHLRKDFDPQQLLITIIDLCVAWHLSKDEWIAKLDWKGRDAADVDEQRLAAIVDFLLAATRPHALPPPTP
jgi:TetR/AcrR family transcriptional regulator